MVSISDIQNGSYYWETEDSHANNTETANDFIKNELPPNVDVYFQDANGMTKYQYTTMTGTHKVQSINTRR